MPLYEYHCHRCGKNFEVMQKFSDEPLAVHDECGGELEKLLSAPALQFKGTGWYVTDYGRGNSNGKESKTAKTESFGSDSAKSESKTDSKPAASETKPSTPATNK
jgi:putative FmdB family regulatory protein